MTTKTANIVKVVSLTTIIVSNIFLRNMALKAVDKFIDSKIKNQSYA